MDKVSPCLWFDGNAEEAANFYVSLLPDSRIDSVDRAPTDYPAGSAGDVLTVEFTLAGRSFTALNGGPNFKFNEAVSFSIACEDQAEVDRLWDTLIADGGSEVQCGWLKDRFGLSWQVVPKRMHEMLVSPDHAAARRAFQAMMEMVKLDLPTLERAFAGD
ncbi:MAG: VOC family protein [Allosphingosinicella sp.]